MSQRPNWSLILLETWSRCALCQFGPVKLPLGPRRGHSLKFLPHPHLPRCLRQKKLFLDKRNALKWSKSMYEEVFLLSVPFRSKHFDAFWHFLSFRSYTPCFGYNKLKKDWLTLILCLNWTCRIWFWILFLRPFCIVLSDLRIFYHFQIIPL